MSSRLDNSSKISGEKNDFQSTTGRSTNWNVFNFKPNNGYKSDESSNSGNVFGEQNSTSKNKKKRWWKFIFRK